MSDRASERRSRRVGWRTVASIVVTAVVLAVLVRALGGAGELWDAVTTARPAYVALAFALSCACVLLGALRWQLVLRPTGHTLPFARSLVVVLAAWPLAVVTPSRANELLRPLAVRDRVPLGVGVGSVLAEKAIDLFVLLAFAAIGAAVEGLWPWSALVGAALIAETTVLVLIFARRAWLARLPLVRRRPESIEEAFAALSALARAPAQLAAVVAVSFTIRLLTVAVTYALLVGVGADVTLGDTIALWPAAMVAGVVPLTLGGMGTRDGAFLGLLAARGRTLAASSVLAATIGYSAVAVWSFAIIGLPFMVHVARRVRAREQDGPG